MKPNMRSDILLSLLVSLFCLSGCSLQKGQDLTLQQETSLHSRDHRKAHEDHSLVQERKLRTKDEDLDDDDAEGQGKASDVDQDEGQGESDDDEDLAVELDSVLGGVMDYSKLDPLEKFNRFLYTLHRGVDLMFVRPLALTYTKALPSPIRKGFANFIHNLTAPLRALCWLLQGNVEQVGRTLGKFTTNTVFGLGGIFDVAKKWGLKEVPTNFALTFKKWGAKPGPYIVVPGIGPATFRTALGMLFDSFIDPVFLLTLNKSLPYNQNHKLTWLDTGAQVSGLLMARGEIDPIYEDVEKNSVNRYSKLRNLVLQQAINQ